MFVNPNRAITWNSRLNQTKHVQKQPEVMEKQGRIACLPLAPFSYPSSSSWSCTLYSVPLIIIPSIRVSSRYSLTLQVTDFPEFIPNIDFWRGFMSSTIVSYTINVSFLKDTIFNIIERIKGRSHSSYVQI